MCWWPCCSPCETTDIASDVSGKSTAHAFSGSIDPIFRFALSQLILDNGSPVASGSYLRRVAPRVNRDAVIIGTVYRFPDDAGSITPTQTGIVIAGAYAIWMHWADNTVRYGAVDAIGEIGAGTIIKTFGSAQTSKTLHIYAMELPNLNYNVFFAYVDGGIPVFAAAEYDVSPSGLTGTDLNFGVFGVLGGGWSNVITACSGSDPCGVVCEDGTALYWSFPVPVPTDLGADVVLVLVDPTSPLGVFLQAGQCLWSNATGGSMTIDTTDKTAWPPWTFADVGGGHFQRPIVMNWHLARDTGEAVVKMRLGMLASPTSGVNTTPHILALYEIDEADFECLDVNTLTKVSDTSAILGSDFFLSEHYTWPATIDITPDI